MILNMQSINKQFDSQTVLKDFSLKVEENEFLVILGKSGCGKSTLLNIIGLLDKPDSGEITIFNQQNVKPFTKNANKLLRNKIGYLFQNFALLEDKTVEENMLLCLEHTPGNKEELIKDALTQVGLFGYEDKKIYKCSGGEQQRVALARLLIKPCELILADEPTGSLDKDNKKIVLDLLAKLNQDGKTVIVVTHDEEVKKYAKRILYLDRERKDI